MYKRNSIIVNSGGEPCMQPEDHDILIKVGQNYREIYDFIFTDAHKNKCILNTMLPKGHIQCSLYHFDLYRYNKIVSHNFLYLCFTPKSNK